MTGKIKSVADGASGVIRTGRVRTARMALASAPITPTRFSSKIRGPDGGRGRHAFQIFLGNLLGRLPDDMTLAYHYQRRTASSDLT